MANERPDNVEELEVNYGDREHDRRYHGSERRKEPWHLSRGVPIAIVGALLLQTVVLTTWAATFKSEFVSYRSLSERQFSDMKDYIDARTEDRYTLPQAIAEARTRDVQITQLKEKDLEVMTQMKDCQRSINNRLQRIEDKIDNHQALIHNGG